MDSKTFLSKVAKQADMDTTKVAEFVSAFATTLKDRAANLDSIAIPGFGNFVAIKHSEKIVNESDGSRSLLPPEIQMEFVASAMLKKQVAEYKK